MLVRELRQRPPCWEKRRGAARGPFVVPLHAIEWGFEWIAYSFSRWAFLEVLEYLGTLSLIFAVISYGAGGDDRLKQKHYQAWQVINTAQGKGGNGGRIEALQELNADRVPLVGVDVSGAFLKGIRIPRARLSRADLRAIDARDSIFEQCDFAYADLRSANFRNADLSGASLQHVNLEDADLAGATLRRVELTAANLKGADLHGCDLEGIAWKAIRSIESANIFGIRNAPDGFIAWAQAHGAVSNLTED